MDEVLAVWVALSTFFLLLHFSGSCSFDDWDVVASREIKRRVLFWIGMALWPVVIMGVVLLIPFWLYKGLRGIRRSYIKAKLREKEAWEQRVEEEYQRAIAEEV